MRKDKELHIRLTAEQYQMLKKVIPNVSEFLRQKIEEELQSKLPEKLERRREELKKELEEVESKLELLKQRYKSERKQKLEKIYGDFVRFERYQHLDIHNLQWLRGRYDNLSIPVEEILQYCKEKWRRENEQ